jgi:integrase
MATIRQRAGSWNVYWRLGGRGGPTQSTTWPTEEYAQRAAQIAEAHQHRITAEKVEATILGEPDAPKKSALPTVAEWAETYLTAKTRITPNTRGKYRSMLDLEILPAIGHLRLDEVEGVHISHLLTALGICDCPVRGEPPKGPRCARTRSRTSHGLTPKTVTRYYAVIHAMFGYAVREKKIADNPAKRTDFVRDLIAHDDLDAEGADHVYLTPAEYHLIRAHADPQTRTVLDYLIGTGARWGEATAAAVASVDPMANPPVARIHRAWKFRPPAERTPDEPHAWYIGATKGRSRRTVEIGQTLLESLLPVIAGEPEDAPLLRTQRGGFLEYNAFARRRFAPAVIAAMRCEVHPPAPRGRTARPDELVGPRCGDNGGVRTNGTPCRAVVVPGMNRCKDHIAPARDAVSDCACPTRLRKQPTIHDLRHTHAAWLIAAGEPIIAISRRLGHHSITITERVYAGILPRVNQAIVAALDAAMATGAGAGSTAAATAPTRDARAGGRR